METLAREGTAKFSRSAAVSVIQCGGSPSDSDLAALPPWKVVVPTMPLAFVYGVDCAPRDSPSFARLAESRRDLALAGRDGTERTKGMGRMRMGR